jgi:hypothetical protein
MPLGAATASNKTRTSCEVTKWLTAMCHLTRSSQTVWKGTSEDHTPFSEDKHEYILRHTLGAIPGFWGLKLMKFWGALCKKNNTKLRIQN